MTGWTKISACKKVELNESTVYLSCTELMKDIIDANKNEFESLRQNDVFEEVKAVGQQPVTSKWIRQRQLNLLLHGPHRP